MSYSRFSRDQNVKFLITLKAFLLTHIWVIFLAIKNKILADKLIKFFENQKLLFFIIFLIKLVNLFDEFSPPDCYPKKFQYLIKLMNLI